MTKYSGNEELYLGEVLRGQAGPHGTWVNSLEKEFASLFKAKYAIAMNSGTATLHSSLVALGVKEGDEVITPSLSVIMDTTCILQTGATPVYADIDKDSFLIDPEDIERKISSKTKAIIVVSLYGLPCDMDRINSISATYNIPVIEDHAQCFLPFPGYGVSLLSNSFSSWSFESTKHLSCGEGGILLTNDSNLAEQSRKIAGHGYKNLRANGGSIKFGNKSLVQDPNYKRHDILGWNYRLSEFSASIALGQLEKVDFIIERRRKVASLFLEVISKYSFISSQLSNPNLPHSYFTLGLKWDHPTVSWYDLRDKYIELGGDGFYAAWSLPYKEPLMSKYFFPEPCCPVAEDIQPKLLQLKTNYRCLKTASHQALLFQKALDFFL